MPLQRLGCHLCNLYTCALTIPLNPIYLLNSFYSFKTVIKYHNPQKRPKSAPQSTQPVHAALLLPHFLPLCSESSHAPPTPFPTAVKSFGPLLAKAVFPHLSSPKWGEGVPFKVKRMRHYRNLSLPIVFLIFKH